MIGKDTKSNQRICEEHSFKDLRFTVQVSGCEKTAFILKIIVSRTEGIPLHVKQVSCPVTRFDVAPLDHYQD